jgi:hypothetical protein
MLLWRQAARVFRAKGYSNFTAADELEKKFGEGQGLGRSRLALLVTTQCEPCPEAVADFILNELEVKDPKAWAEYLREVANEPPETQSAAPAVVAGPREAREVAKEAAGEVASAVTARLDKTEGLLEALRARLETFVTQAEWKFHGLEKQLSGVLSTLGGKLDTFASSVREQLGASASTIATIDIKLDHAQAQFNNADTQLEFMRYALSAIEKKREKDKQEIVRAAWGGGVLAVLGCVVFMHCHAPTAVTANVHVRAGVTQEAARSENSPLHFDRAPGIAGELGGRKVRAVSRTPMPGQAVTPCQGSERTLYGSCWILTGDAAPCPPDQFQDGQRCYVPVMDHSKPPIGGLLAPNPEHP